MRCRFAGERERWRGWELRRVRTETRFICEEEARRDTESLVLFYTEMKREMEIEIEIERECVCVCLVIRREIQERVRDNMGYYKRTGRIGREGGGDQEGAGFLTRKLTCCAVYIIRRQLKYYKCVYIQLNQSTIYYILTTK